MSWLKGLKELLNDEQLTRIAAEQEAARGLPMPAAIFDFEDVAEV